MVSGLVTSPCDQLRIFSGEAKLMRIESKSAIGLAKSKGLERNKVFLQFLRPFAAAGGTSNLAPRQGHQHGFGTIIEVHQIGQFSPSSSQPPGARLTRGEG